MNRPRFFKSLALKYFAIAALPLAALFYTQIANFAVLAFGEQVLLETVPVDPRDMLRGDYVTLGYKISDIDEEIIERCFGDAAAGSSGGREVFVILKTGGDGVGSVESASASRPAGGLYLRGHYYYWSGVDYGIGRYYVPEGTGREIEDMIRGGPDKKVLVDVRVFKGHPVIKGLRFIEP